MSSIRPSVTWVKGLNGLWSPFGIETGEFSFEKISTNVWLNGLWSPFGIETLSVQLVTLDRYWLNGLCTSIFRVEVPG